MEEIKDYDVLILDDIQSLSGRERAQNEVLNILDAFIRRDKQVIITARRYPKYLRVLLEDGLLSRFMGGVTIEILYPNFDTRKDIIERIVIEKCLRLSEFDFIVLAKATHGWTVRELEGLLNYLEVQIQMGKNLSDNDLKEVASCFMEIKKAFIN